MFVALVLPSGSTSALPKVKIPPITTAKNAIVDQDIMEERRTGDTAEDFGVFKSSTPVNGDETTIDQDDSLIIDEPGEIIYSEDICDNVTTTTPPPQKVTKNTKTSTRIGTTISTTTAKLEERTTESPTSTTAKPDEKATESPINTTTTAKPEEETTDFPTNAATSDKPEEETTRSPDEGTSEPITTSNNNTETASVANDSSSIRISGEKREREVKKMSGSIRGNLKNNEKMEFTGDLYREKNVSFSLDLGGGLLGPILTGIAGRLLN